MATSKAELFERFASFPNQSHVDNVCRPGQGAKTCRYLAGPTRSGLRYSCQKYGLLREVIDERVRQGTTTQRGDNCGGLVELMQQSQADLEGLPTHYAERMPTIEADGIYRGITNENGVVAMGGLGLSEDFALLEVRPTGITLTARGVGASLGEETVYFEKPSR